jgi:hypothetical protein
MNNINNEPYYEYKPVLPVNNNINENNVNNNLFNIPQLDNNIYDNPMLKRFRPKTSTVTINENQNYSIKDNFHYNENNSSLNSRVTPKNFVDKLNYLDNNNNPVYSTLNTDNNNNQNNINSYDKFLRRNYSSNNFSNNILNINKNENININSNNEINNVNNIINNNSNQTLNNIDMMEYRKQLQRREAELIGKFNDNYSNYQKELEQQRYKLNENFSQQNNISYLNTKNENVPYYIKNHAKKEQIPVNPFNERDNDLGPSFLNDNPILYPTNTYKFDITRLTPNSYYNNNKKY